MRFFIRRNVPYFSFISRDAEIDPICVRVLFMLRVINICKISVFP